MAEKENRDKVLVKIDSLRYATFKKVQSTKGPAILFRWILALVLVIIISMFLPWTQNVKGKGTLTTLKPEHRPQKINSIISGRIEKWYVNEGVHVKKGDTIVYLSEVKTEYMDPDLISRTELQLKAKKAKLNSYQRKVDALGNYLAALENEFRIKAQQVNNKIQQYQNKVSIDSTNKVIAQKNFDISERRLNRSDSLYKTERIISLKELESAQLKFQEKENKLVSATNKLMISRNDLLNAQLEASNVFNSYNGLISKGESDKTSAESLLYETQAVVSKLENKLQNYKIRNGYYYITAPKEGYIVKAYKPGRGEIVKEGMPIVEMMPIDVDLAVELYIEPVNLPLMNIDDHVRLTFDGWPALVFSGWPSTSFGTFGGKIYAIDKVIDKKKKKYRLIIVPDPEKDNIPWPQQLKVGAGVQGIFLLKDVPVWYEIWRQINGFAPGFYKEESEETKPKAMYETKPYSPHLI